jgi:hypothetical protein
MIWQRDHMVRRIYMTDRHSENLKPSWFGESIGRYEPDGTFVIDTIALSTRNSYLDWYRTPHGEKERVIERFKSSADGRTLEALVMVEDPDTFNHRSTWCSAGARRRIRSWRRPAPRTTAILSARTCFRSRRPTRPISDRAEGPERSQLSDRCNQRPSTACYKTTTCYKKSNIGSFSKRTGIQEARY